MLTHFLAIPKTIQSIHAHRQGRLSGDQWHLDCPIPLRTSRHPRHVFGCPYSKVLYHIERRSRKCGKPQEHVLALFYKSESKEAVTKPEIISKFSGIQLTHCYKEDYNK